MSTWINIDYFERHLQRAKSIRRKVIMEIWEKRQEDLEGQTQMTH